MTNQDFNAIMETITSGLTGNPEKDIPYLDEQMEIYKTHEYKVEILRECGRLIYSMLPEDKKNEINKEINKKFRTLDESIEDVRFKMYKKDYDAALEKIEEIAKKYENSYRFDTDEVSLYHDFSESFERVLFYDIYEPEKELRDSPIKFAEIHLIYGSILFELNRFDEAEMVLKKAMRWNPCNAKIAFEHAETFLARNRINQYLDETFKIYEIIFKADDLARFYRNLGYYYIDIEDYQLAACCEVMSLHFEKSQKAQSELLYILSKDNTVDVSPSLEIIKQYFDMNDIPFGVSDQVIELAYTLTTLTIEQGEKEAAMYFFNILNTFIENEQVLELKEEIDKM